MDLINYYFSYELESSTIIFSNKTLLPPDKTDYNLTVDYSGEYKMRITSINGNGQALWSDYFYYSTENAVGPSAVVNLTANNTDSFSIKLDWETPVYNGGASIEAYTAEIVWSTDPNVNYSITTISTSVFFTSLYFGQYEISVWATNAAGDGELNQMNFSLPDIPGSVPGEVLNLIQTNAYYTSFTVSWDAAFDNGAPILTYYLNIKELQRNYTWYNTSVSPTQLTFTDEPILSGSYGVYVIAENRFGNSTDTFRMANTLSSTVPAQMSDINATSNSSISFNVTWTDPNNGGSLITGYLLNYTLLETSASFIKTIDVGTFEYTVTDVLSGNYSICMKAININGESNFWSNVVDVETLPPTYPTSIVGFDSIATRTSLNISWIGPESNGGAEVTGYYVAYEISPTSKEKYRKTTDAKNLGLSYNFTAQPKLDLEGLLTQTFYTFTVIATNSFYNGTATEFEASTAQYAPAQIKGVVLKGVTSTSLTIGWDDPNDSEITGYNISINGTVVLTIEAASQFLATVTDLEPAVYYAVAVCAFVGNYTGNYSEPLEVVTDPDVPGPVSSMSLDSSTDNSLTIKWSAANPNGKPIEYYLVNATDGSSQPLLAYPVSTKTTFANLKASTKYYFTITAHNSIGDSETSPQQDFSTKAKLNVGLIAGLTVSLCSVGIIIAVIVVWKRKAPKIPKLPPPPDFTPFMYGTIYEAEFSDEEKQKIEGMADLKEIIVDPELDLVKALFRVVRPSDADSLCRATTFLLEGDGKETGLDLIKYTIRKETNEIIDPTTLFRSNSFASKLLGVYSKLYGLPYLYRTIAFEIFMICQELTDPVEVDERKLQDVKEDVDLEDPDINSIDVNKWRLLVSGQKILHRICKSASRTPVQFKEISRELQQRISYKFPDSRDLAVGSFFFLRFICPSIIAPDAYGLVSSAPSDTARRHLVLVAKTLQNVANGTKFKEESLEDLSIFISANKQKAYDFFDQIAQPVERTEEVAQIQIPKNVLDSSLAVFHRFISFHKDRLLEDLEENDPDLKAKLIPIIERIGEPIKRQKTKI
ncbi:ras gtpase-activating protein [Anaeramoeba ignava]|uniref:Ras gtpase-activating protein n=1 Tax=Anaeramoeba ignava TaxID=1746090 RepID=A0A9Q0LX50_ANAIG|nr:ras gtpase-activating protein [Anaeramoeba ignava]